MSNQVFDFCDTSRVFEEVPPDEPSAMSMNGWDFTSKPKIPYRPSFKLTLYGLKWYLNVGGTALDKTTNVKFNMGKLRDFYLTHRMWDSFLITHEYLGSIRVRFAKPPTFPPASPASGGMVEAFEIMLIQENPSYS